MAITAKKKERLREQGLVEKKPESERRQNLKTCTCLVAIRGRGQHGIGCALYGE